MSRTVRRKNDSKSTGYYRNERYWTYDTDQEHAKLHGGWKSYVQYYTKEIKWYYQDVAWGGQKSIPKEGKAYQKGWWIYHNDTLRCWSGGKGPGYFMTELQRTYRRRAKREIQKALANDDYEAIIPTKPKRDWWD